MKSISINIDELSDLRAEIHGEHVYVYGSNKVCIYSLDREEESENILGGRRRSEKLTISAIRDVILEGMNISIICASITESNKRQESRLFFVEPQSGIILRIISLGKGKAGNGRVACCMDAHSKSCTIENTDSSFSSSPPPNNSRVRSKVDVAQKGRSTPKPRKDDPFHFRVPLVVGMSDGKIIIIDAQFDARSFFARALLNDGQLKLEEEGLQDDDFNQIIDFVEYPTTDLEPRGAVRVVKFIKSTIYSNEEGDNLSIGIGLHSGIFERFSLFNNSIVSQFNLNAPIISIENIETESSFYFIFILESSRTCRIDVVESLKNNQNNVVVSVPSTKYFDDARIISLVPLTTNMGGVVAWIRLPFNSESNAELKIFSFSSWSRRKHRDINDDSECLFSHSLPKSGEIMDAKIDLKSLRFCLDGSMQKSSPLSLNIRMIRRSDKRLLVCGLHKTDWVACSREKISLLVHKSAKEMENEREDESEKLRIEIVEILEGAGRDKDFKAIMDSLLSNHLIPVATRLITSVNEDCSFLAINPRFFLLWASEKLSSIQKVWELIEKKLSILDAKLLPQSRENSEEKWKSVENWKEELEVIKGNLKGLFLIFSALREAHCIGVGVPSSAEGGANLEKQLAIIRSLSNVVSLITWMISNKVMYDFNNLSLTLDERRLKRVKSFEFLNSSFPDKLQLRHPHLFIDKLTEMSVFCGKQFPPKSLKNLCQSFFDADTEASTSLLQANVIYLSICMILRSTERIENANDFTLNQPNEIVSSLGTELDCPLASQNALLAFWILDNGKDFHQAVTLITDSTIQLFYDLDISILEVLMSSSNEREAVKYLQCKKIDISSIEHKCLIVKANLVGGAWQDAVQIQREISSSPYETQILFQYTYRWFVDNNLLSDFVMLPWNIEEESEWIYIVKNKMKSNIENALKESDMLISYFLLRGSIVEACLLHEHYEDMISEMPPSMQAVLQNPHFLTRKLLVAAYKNTINSSDFILNVNSPLNERVRAVPPKDDNENDDNFRRKSLIYNNMEIEGIENFEKDDGGAISCNEDWLSNKSASRSSSPLKSPSPPKLSNANIVVSDGEEEEMVIFSDEDKDTYPLVSITPQTLETNQSLRAPSVAFSFSKRHITSTSFSPFESPLTSNNNIQSIYPKISIDRDISIGIDKEGQQEVNNNNNEDEEMEVEDKVEEEAQDEEEKVEDNVEDENTNFQDQNTSVSEEVETFFVNVNSFNSPIPPPPLSTMMETFSPENVKTMDSGVHHSQMLPPTPRTPSILLPSVNKSVKIPSTTILTRSRAKQLKNTYEQINVTPMVSFSKDKKTPSSVESSSDVIVGLMTPGLRGKTPAQRQRVRVSRVSENKNNTSSSLGGHQYSLRNRTKLQKK